MKKRILSLLLMLSVLSSYSISAIANDFYYPINEIIDAPSPDEWDLSKIARMYGTRLAKYSYSKANGMYTMNPYSTIT